MALVYVPDTLPELVTVEPKLPTPPPQFSNLVQRARAPERREGYPALIPAAPQPLLDFALFVALPAWVTESAVVFFDCSRIDQGVFAAKVSLRLNRESLLLAAGLPTDMPVKLFVHGLLHHLTRGQIITLRNGMTISVVPVQEGAPAGYDLDVRLLSREGWNLDSELPGPRNFYGMYFRVLTDAWPLNFQIKTGRREHFREDLAQALGAGICRLSIKSSYPRIIDVCSYGLWTSSLLVATEQLIRIPCPPART